MYETEPPRKSHIFSVHFIFVKSLAWYVDKCICIIYLIGEKKSVITIQFIDVKPEPSEI